MGVGEGVRVIITYGSAYILATSATIIYSSNHNTAATIIYSSYYNYLFRRVVVATNAHYFLFFIYFLPNHYDYLPGSVLSSYMPGEIRPLLICCISSGISSLVSDEVVASPLVWKLCLVDRVTSASH